MQREDTAANGFGCIHLQHVCIKRDDDAGKQSHQVKHEDSREQRIGMCRKAKKTAWKRYEAPYHTIPRRY